MFKLAITGQFRRGKDTLADVVEGLCSEPVERLAFADQLKRTHSGMVRHWLLSWDETANTRLPGFNKSVSEMSIPEWDAAMRSLRQINGVGWQWLGEFYRQVFGEDYWINAVGFNMDYREALERGDSIIITDMRHHNESDWCYREGFLRLRVNGPCRAPDDIRDKDHPSEKHIPMLWVDAEYDNTGSLEDMEAFVKNKLLPGLAVPRSEWLAHFYLR